MSRYEVYGKIGAGGAATVHLARFVGAGSFHRVVAAKRLKPHIARDEDARAALVAEALLASRVNHPNVVSLLDIIVEDKELFVVMDYVHGEAFNRLLGASKRGGGPPPMAISLAVVASILRALHAAHDARGTDGGLLQIVHRDVSPQNVVVGVDGVARLLDFGVAKATARTYRTRTGEVKGKLGYMAPEQLCGEPVDRRADIFAAGVILWESLVGSRLFRGATDEETVALMLEGRVERPSVRTATPVPDSIDEIALNALAADPRDRFATALEMAIAIEKHPIATVSEVGAWVEQLAKEGLDERSRILAKMNDDRPELVLSLDHSALAAEPTTTGSRVAIATAPVATGKSRGGPRPRGLVVVVLGVLVGIAVAALAVPTCVSSRREGVGPVAVASAPPAPSGPLASLDSSGGMTTRYEPRTDDASAWPSTVTSSDRSRRGRAPKRSPEPCSPPFTFDESGHKHFKPECF